MKPICGWIHLVMGEFDFALLCLPFRHNTIIPTVKHEQKGFVIPLENFLYVLTYQRRYQKDQIFIHILVVTGKDVLKSRFIFN